MIAGAERAQSDLELACIDRRWPLTAVMWVAAVAGVSTVAMPRLLLCSRAEDRCTVTQGVVPVARFDLSQVRGAKLSRRRADEGQQLYRVVVELERGEDAVPLAWYYGPTIHQHAAIAVEVDAFVRDRARQRLAQWGSPWHGWCAMACSFLALFLLLPWPLRSAKLSVDRGSGGIRIRQEWFGRGAPWSRLHRDALVTDESPSSPGEVELRDRRGRRLGRFAAWDVAAARRWRESARAILSDTAR